MIESPRDLRISGGAPSYHILDVLLAILHVESELLKVPDNQLLVREELLILHQVSNLALAHAPILLLGRVLTQDIKVSKFSCP